MKNDLALTVQDHGSALVFSLAGDVDYSQTPRLQNRMEEVLNEGHRLLIFRLGGVRYMDSVGYQVLIAARARLLRTGGTVCLVEVPARLRRVLALTRLETLFPICETEEDALHSKDGPGPDEEKNSKAGWSSAPAARVREAKESPEDRPPQGFRRAIERSLWVSGWRRDQELLSRPF